MLDTARTFFQRLTDHVRVVDLLDVAVVAVAVYLCLVWLGRAASRAALLTLGLLVGLYFVAHAFDMYLSSLLFQAGFTAILLGLILIFQEDIRRGLESLTAWGVRGEPEATPNEQRIVDVLTESVARLADMSIGALLVFQGKQPLDRHIRGGVRVRGEISLPLLQSIFDPHSPGHDGAVLVRGERIEMLGVHLPLSENLREVGQGGTRHTAALGLAERTDAMIVVVSEERGTISVASGSRLEPLESAAQLKGRLEDYYERLHPAGARRWKTWLTRNLGLKALAIAAACLLWMAFAFRFDTVQHTFQAIPVYSNLPEGWVVVSDTTVQVTVSGPERAFQLLNPDRLTLTVDMRDAKLGPQDVVYPAKNVQLPRGLRVTDMRPNAERLNVYRAEEVTLEVEVEIDRGTELPAGLHLVEFRAEPPLVRASVLVDGENGIRRIKVPTDRIDLGQLTAGSHSVEVGLNPPDGVNILTDSKVRVWVTVAADKAASDEN